MHLGVRKKESKGVKIMERVHHLPIVGQVETVDVHRVRGLACTVGHALHILLINY